MNTLLKKSFAVLSWVLLVCFASQASAQFIPSQAPPANRGLPGNLALALSVEWPTGVQTSYTASTYAVATRYDGYFDNRKCYSYSTVDELFTPSAKQDANGSCLSATDWSGNLLNWLTMSNIDQFRSVLTGGTRDNFTTLAASGAGDSTTSTVLIRSFSDRNAGGSITVVKNFIAGTAGMPINGGGTLYARSGGYGSKFIVRSNTTFADMSAAQQRDTCSGNGATFGTCFNVRIRACLPVGTGANAVGLEANCNTSYSGAAKPEGLIQQYANNMRFSAHGYLNETGVDRNGAVLRSAMKSVGSLAVTASGTSVVNTAAEWNSVTGVIYRNPDATDATASNVQDSGLINYLNKFGYTAGYKGNDPVSELYYATLAYLRGVSVPDDYSNNLTAARLDGFPAITGNSLKANGTRDPIISSCQKNFILGIGDIYTHCDGNLPGSTLASNCPAGNGIFTDPSGLNVDTLWNTVAGLEGISPTGWIGGSSRGTPYMAGLAHWANTNDIRSDISGTQTVSTYWVDVLENGNGVATVGLASLRKSQFWLAAKYGGFKTSVANGNNPNTNNASWDLNGDGVPDNWFAGSNPTLMRSGLSTAFASIANASGPSSASTSAISSSRKTSNSQILFAGYSPNDWSGSLYSCGTGQTTAQCRSNPTWEASRWLKTSAPTLVATPLTSLTRKIITASSTSTTFVASTFQFGSLTSVQKSVLNGTGTDTLGTLRLNYIRGDRSNEGTSFRARSPNLLGDFVNSGVTYVAGTGPAYVGSNFVGHANYRISNRNRPAVAYIGANDGMLHAFSATNGKELFGYIPSIVYANLPGLTAPAFTHKYFVDSTPMVADYQVNGTNTWATGLVGGLGGGGKGYYALNVTSQATFGTATEATLASNLPMWEVSDATDTDIGFTFNEPSINSSNGAFTQIAKVASNTAALGVWRALVGNGYGSAGGKAILMFLNMDNGAISTKLQADAGSNNGLSTPTAVDTDNDGLVDTIYAGDLTGKVHKFQFAKQVGANYVIARPGAAGGGDWRYIGVLYDSGAPITTAPTVALACDGIGYNVSVGTGKLSEDSDRGTTNAQSFFNVLDNALSSNLTVTSSQLATVTYTTSLNSAGDSVRNWGTPNLVGKRGWRMVFTGGERVLSNSTIPPDSGAVLFATTTPDVSNACVSTASSFIMAVNSCTGAGGNLIFGGQLVGGVGVATEGVLRLSRTQTNDNNQQQVICNQGSCGGGGGGGNGPLIKGVNVGKARFSWREILSK